MTGVRKLLGAGEYARPAGPVEFLNWGSGGAGSGSSAGVDVSSWDIQSGDTILIMYAVAFSYPVYAGGIAFDTAFENGGTNRTSLFTEVTRYAGIDSGYYYEGAQGAYVYFCDDVLPTTYVYIRTGQSATALTSHVAHFRNATTCTLVGNTSGAAVDRPDIGELADPVAYTEATGLQLSDHVVSVFSKASRTQRTVTGPTNSDANTPVKGASGTGGTSPLFDSRSVMSRKAIAGNHTFQFTGATTTADENSDSWSTTTVRLR